MTARGFLFATALAACQPADSPPPPPPPPPAPIIGLAGPTTLVTDGAWMPLAGTTRAAFAADPQHHLRALPADLPPDAQLGTMWTGPGAPSPIWILTGDAQRGYAFRLDANLDGDLTNDPVYPLAPAPGAPADWTATITAALPAPLIFGVTVHAGEVAAITTTERRGTLAVGARRVAFTAQGVMGRYGADKETVAFDLDGDGEADTDPDSPEALLVRDRGVTIDGATYAFAVAPDGSRVTLTPAPASLAPAALTVGALAPELPELVARRGQVVVLDFWARWCEPCVAAIPSLVALAADPRVAIVSVAVDDDPASLGEFAAAHHMTWPQQLAEPNGGPRQARYRVAVLPATFVIDRDGRIACARCTAAELAAVVARAVAAPGK